MKVKMEFVPKDERKGDLMDMYAVAVPGQKVPEWACLQKDPEQLKMLEDSMKATLGFIKNRYSLDNSVKARGW
jgi:hypothetical protein